MGQGGRRAGAGRGAAVWRTAVAIAALLLFWGALARSLWPEFAPILLRMLGAVHGASAGAETIETERLVVRVASRAAEPAVREAIARLEADLAAIEGVVGPHPAPAASGGGDPLPSRASVVRIPVTVVDGAGPALSDGRGLTLFHDGGRIDLSTAPFFLALLREGALSMSGLRFFVDGGYAVYLAEEAGRAGPLLGQSSDAWVALLCDAGTYLPLAEAWEAGLPRGERETGLALRALLEGGSFLRWVVEAQGLEAVGALRDGLPVEEAIGMSLAEAEGRWLATLAGIERRACEEAVPERSALRAYCGALVGER